MMRHTVTLTITYTQGDAPGNVGVEIRGTSSDPSNFNLPSDELCELLQLALASAEAGYVDGYSATRDGGTWYCDGYNVGRRHPDGTR